MRKLTKKIVLLLLASTITTPRGHCPWITSCVMPVPLLQAGHVLRLKVSLALNACKGGLSRKETTAKYRTTMVTLQNVVRRISVRTSYTVLKMNEDAHVTSLTATELEQCQELTDTENTHQKDRPCSLINWIKYVCKTIKTKFRQVLTHAI